MITAMLVKGNPEWLADNESIAMAHLAIDKFPTDSDVYTVCYTEKDGTGPHFISLTCDVVTSEEEQVSVMSDIVVTENNGLKFEKIQQKFISGQKVDINNVLIALTLLDTYDDKSKPFFSDTLERITDILGETGDTRNYTNIGRWVKYIIPNKVQPIYFDARYTVEYISRFFKTRRHNILIDSHEIDHSEHIGKYVQFMLEYGVTHDIISDITLMEMLYVVPANKIDWVMDNVQDIESFVERITLDILHSNIKRCPQKHDKLRILGKLYYRNKKPFHSNIKLVIETILIVGKEYQWVYDLVVGTPYENIMEWFDICRVNYYPFNSVMDVVPELYNQRCAIAIASFCATNQCEYIIEKVFNIELNRTEVNPEILTILFSILCDREPELAKQIAIFNSKKLKRISPEIKQLCLYISERDNYYDY